GPRARVPGARAPHVRRGGDGAWGRNAKRQSNRSQYGMDPAPLDGDSRNVWVRSAGVTYAGIDCARVPRPCGARRGGGHGSFRVDWSGGRLGWRGAVGGGGPQGWMWTNGAGGHGLTPRPPEGRRPGARALPRRPRLQGWDAAPVRRAHGPLRAVPATE